jgi:hypothetical protein
MRCLLLVPVLDGMNEWMNERVKNIGGMTVTGNQKYKQKN